MHWGVVVKRERLARLDGRTVKVETGCGNLYVTLNSDGGGLQEVFAKLGRAGTCTVCQMEALTRCSTLGLRHGVPVKEFVDELKGIQCPNPKMWPEEERVLSCPDAIANILEEEK